MRAPYIQYFTAWSTLQIPLKIIIHLDACRGPITYPKIKINPEYPLFRVLPSFPRLHPFPRFTLFSAFYPLFRVLPSFPRFTLFRVLPSFPRFTLFSGSAVPFRFRVLPLPIQKKGERMLNWRGNARSLISSPHFEKRAPNFPRKCIIPRR
jgi:hypothetical protein